jgi:hypothetical protein
MANIHMTAAIGSFLIVEDEADMIGVTITKKGIGLYLKEKGQFKITDGVTPCEDLPNIGSHKAVGEIGVYTPNNAPSDYLELDGTWLSKTLYPEIYAIFGDTYGETSSSFKLPDTRELFSYGHWIMPTQLNMNYWIKYK